MRYEQAYLILFLSFLTLAGCSGILVNDQDAQQNGKRTFTKKIQDSAIESQIHTLLNFQNPRFKNESHLEVICANGIVVLAGQVPSFQMKEHAAKAAAKQEFVRKVYNRLRVDKNPYSSDSNDGWLTFKIRFNYLFNDKIPSSQIKIESMQGEVYLLGYLPYEEAKKAVEIARKTKGVKRVINALEYAI